MYKEHCAVALLHHYHIPPQTFHKNSHKEIKCIAAPAPESQEVFTKSLVPRIAISIPCDGRNAFTIITYPGSKGVSYKTRL